MVVKPSSLASSFIVSALLHFAGFALAVGFLTQQSYRREGNPVSVSLLESVLEEKPSEAVQHKISRAPVKKPPQAPAKHETARPENSFSQAKTAPSKAKEPENPLPPTSTPVHDSAASEGGGSAAGVKVNDLPAGDVSAAPGSGTAGSGAGTAVAGFGRASGAPGLPLQTAPLRTNREAKPIQTARASYPPMALRMGMESDVMLRIEVDPQGNVTKAEIIKSGGAGFDEEALKAVRQSRFEPAQRDGQNVAAEFNYVYRFRLQR
ncbi:MAG: energy transducer TonB [Candidatus Binatia bacterium]